MSDRQSGSSSKRVSGGAGSKSDPMPPIVIASKDANQRHANSSSAADPGPGDMEAAPSEMPQPVDIPDPPTASQLVVKSGVGASSRGSSKMLQAGPSNMDLGSGSASGPAASQPSVQAAREPTSSRPLTGPGPGGANGRSSAREPSSVSGGGGGGSVSAFPSAAAAAGGPGSMRASSATGTEPVVPAGGAGSPGSSAASSPAASQGSPGSAAGSLDGRSHHEDEVGEGEVEHDGQEGSPATPTTSGTGIGSSAKLSISSKPKSSIMSSQAAQAFKEGQAGGSGASTSSKPGDKKVTRFRYHKRITVRTSGKNNPQAIMNKVNKGVSPSTIGEIDASDLMKRVGIKNTKHWRIRVRQTKRITKNGKTTTQTKTAYRDSSGNLQPPPGTCKKCARKLSDCKCGPSSSKGGSSK